MRAGDDVRGDYSRVRGHSRAILCSYGTELHQCGSLPASSLSSLGPPSVYCLCVCASGDDVSGDDSRVCGHARARGGGSVGGRGASRAATFVANNVRQLASAPLRCYALRTQHKRNVETRQPPEKDKRRIKSNKVIALNPPRPPTTTTHHKTPKKRR